MPITPTQPNPNPSPLPNPEAPKPPDPGKPPTVPEPKTPPIPNTPDSSPYFPPAEVIQVIDSVVKEAYEDRLNNSSHPSSVNNAGNLSQNSVNPEGELKKGIKIINEFLREVTFLVVERGMEVSQALQKIKVDQNGTFWKAFEQVLQKGSYTEPSTSSRTEKPLEAALGTSADQRISSERKVTTESSTLMAGQAILELLKAEGNPQAQKEHFLAALQFLRQGNCAESERKLLRYLRGRKDFSEQELEYYLGERSFPRSSQRLAYTEEKSLLKASYIFFPILAFGASIGLGLGWEGGLTVGLGTALLLFLVSWIAKK